MVLQDRHVIGVNICIQIEEPSEEEDLQYLIGDIETKGVILINSNPSGILHITAEMIN